MFFIKEKNYQLIYNFITDIAKYILPYNVFRENKIESFCVWRIFFPLSALSFFNILTSSLTYFLCPYLLWA